MYTAHAVNAAAGKTLLWVLRSWEASGRIQKPIYAMRSQSVVMISHPAHNRGLIG